MPGPVKVRLRRKDGSTIDVSPDQAEKLKVLGYTEETPVERSGRLGDEAVDDYYSTPYQQFATAVEGAGAGITAGLSDYFLGSDETKERARANPGIRVATEIGGAVLGAGVRATPVGAVSQGAAAAVKGGGVARGAARGVIEGGVLGGAFEANHAYLAGDPVTAEAVLHGMGWGALFGGGIGGVAGGLQARGAANMARGAAAEAEGAGVLASSATKAADDVGTKLAAREAELAREAAGLKQASENYLVSKNMLRASDEAAEAGVAAREAEFAAQRAGLKGEDLRVRELQTAANDERAAKSLFSKQLAEREAEIAAREAELSARVTDFKGKVAEDMAAGPKYAAEPGHYARVATAPYSAFQAEVRSLRKGIETATGTAKAMLSGDAKALAKLGLESLPAGVSVQVQAKLNKQLAKLVEALDDPKVTQKTIQGVVDEYRKLAGKAIDRAGAGTSGAGALEEYASMLVIQRELKGIPMTAEAFAKMTPERAGRLFAALDEAGSLSSFKNMSDATNAQVSRLQESLGLAQEGLPGLRKVWEQSRKLVKAESTKVPNQSLVTQKAELAIQKAQIRAEKTALAADKAATKAEVKSAIESQLAETKAKVAEAHAKLNAEIASYRAAQRAEAANRGKPLAEQGRGLSEAKAKLATARAELQAEKAAYAAQKEAATEAVEKFEPGWGRKIAAWAGGLLTYKAVAATGHPLAGLGAGQRVRNAILKGAKTPELVAARNMTMGRIKQAVGKYQVTSGKALAKVGPKIEPLARKLDGTLDTSTKDKSQLAYNRINEFAMASTHVKETLFRAVEPIAVEQPELGPALHNAAVSAFTAARSMLPADPGVVSGLKSIWKPSQLQAAVMSRQIEVFQDPVGVAEEMLFTGVFDPIRVKAMKEIAPSVFQHMQSELIERIQEPGFLDNMNYKDQWALGSLMDIPIHSSMRPEYIAASQALHMTRNQPLPTPAMPGGSDAGGRPAADTPGATQAQITTQR
jgi:hypothetical protein